MFCEGIVEKHTEDLKYWLCLGKNPKIGALSFKQIMATSLSFKEVLNSSEEKLIKAGLPKKLVREIIISQKSFKPDRVITELKKYKVSAITINNPNYPELLKEIYDPPTILYYRGNLNLNELMVGIVGSRKPTDYGRHITYDLSYKLALCGVTIVSGLALGTDSIAHQAALDAKGKTIAVLGCGLDKIYPSSHERLAKEMLDKKSGIVSEYPIGTAPTRYSFPIRNRIISGLCQALIVTEAAEGSGSLITAKSALEQNREVFAVPGSIYNKNSFGTNHLIKSGTHLLSDVQDIFDEFGLTAPKTAANLRKLLPRNTDEKEIFHILKYQPKHIDLIIKESGLGQSKISSVLTLMEISGKIKHLGGLVYRLNN